MQLRCPVCHTPLTLSGSGKQLCCDNNHSFDQARQGYWNLLLVQKKRSKDPGDNVEMVQARERFLSRGYYQPISDSLNQLCIDLLTETSNNHPPKVIDLGCGEGYYTSAFEQALSSSLPKSELIGLDISKHAVKAACRRNSNLTWLVGSSADIPVPDHQLDLATIVFSRVLGEPLKRALSDTGLVVIVHPAARHLYSLRELIYETVIDKPFDPAASLGDGFTHLKTERVTFDICLNGSEQISDLLAMTPHGQRLRADKREQLLTRDQLETQVDVELAVFKRIS